MDNSKILVALKKIVPLLASVTIIMTLISLSGCDFNFNTVKIFAVKEKDVTSVAKNVQKGGIMHIGGEQEPDSLNPYLSDLNVVGELGNLIYDGLLAMNDKGEWVPRLATEVPTLNNSGISADGRTITYHLKQGIKWHDGNLFTADDVKFTWQFALQNKASSFFAANYENIASVDILNTSTVVVKLKQYYPDWPLLFNYIMPKHILADAKLAESFARKPVGTGPFIFKGWDVVTGVEFAANEQYFEGGPNLDGVSYRAVTDNDMLLGQLRSGQFDIVDNVVLDSIEKVQASPTVHLIFVPNYCWEHLDFNLDNPMFSDARVRQAISLLVARREICDNIMKNAAVETYVDQVPLSWAYDATAVPSEKGLIRAKELLREAGWQPGADSFLQKDGKKFAFSVIIPDGNPARQVVANIIVRNLQEAGIEVQIIILPKNEFIAKLQARKFETALYASVNGFDPDVRYRWHSSAIPGSGQGRYGQNYAGWRNAEVDKMSVAAVGTMDVNVRKTIYADIQKKVVEECPVVPLFVYTNVSAVKNSVANYRPNPMQWGMAWNAREWGFYEKTKTK